MINGIATKITFDEALFHASTTHAEHDNIPTRQFLHIKFWEITQVQHQWTNLLFSQNCSFIITICDNNKK